MRSYIGPGEQWVDPHHTGTPTLLVQEDDGRHHHRMSQSMLNTSDDCLERARREMTKEMPHVENDASNVGSAVHTAAEVCTAEHFDGMALTLADTMQVFHDDFSERMLHPAFAWKKYTENSARKFGETCITQWYQQVLPTLPNEGLLEHTFIVPFVDNEQRVIELSGAIDLFTDHPIDYKTSGRGKYLEWEYKRNATQPTVYTYAAWVEGMSPLSGDTFEFEYIVMHDRGGPQRFSVQRDEDDWNALQDKCERLAELIEAELPRWPTNFDSALCSPKWCGSWSECRGQYLGDEPW